MSRSSASSYAHLLRLYPRVWRARYEDEFLALLEDRPPTALHLFDIVLGALDAHVHREIPGVDKAPRGERSWLMNRNLYGGSALAAGALLLFTAYGDMLGLDAWLAMVFVPLLLVAVTAATIGLAARSGHSGIARAGAVLAVLGAVTSLGALGLIVTNARLFGLAGWDIGALTLGALLVGQALTAVGAWSATGAARPGLALLTTGGAWVIAGMAYMELSGDWSSPLVAVGWAIVAAGWLWIGMAALRSPASATA